MRIYFCVFVVDGPRPIKVFALKSNPINIKDDDHNDADAIEVAGEPSRLSTNNDHLGDVAAITADFTHYAIYLTFFIGELAGKKISLFVGLCVIGVFC